MTDKETKNVKIQNSEFGYFCIFYCECLRDAGRFKDIVEVLSFLKANHEVNVSVRY